MDSIEFLTTAHKIMTTDVELVSGGPTPFWKFPCGLSPEEVQWFDQFRKCALVLNDILDDDCSNHIQVIVDYVEMRDRLKHIEDTMQDQKILMAVQMAFMMIMWRAKDLYSF